MYYIQVEKSCNNPNCKCSTCICGSSCTCGTSTVVVCDPCSEFRNSGKLDFNKPIQLTYNGDKDGITCGLADYVAQEEMDRYIISLFYNLFRTFTLKINAGIVVFGGPQKEI